MRVHATADRPRRSREPADDVEAPKDLRVQAGAAFQALRQQANAQMATLAAQLAEFKERIRGYLRQQ